MSLPTTIPKRPILQYHGGKWKLAEWIISNFPAHRVYVEPFGGAASVLLRKQRSYAEVYNDLDGEVVNLFRVVRQHPMRLMPELMLTPFSREEYRARFEQERQRAKNTWVLLLKRDTVVGQVRCELSHPTAMDEEKRIVGWSERIILPPVEFDPTPNIDADDEGPDDGEITIDIKRRA